MPFSSTISLAINHSHGLKFVISQWHPVPSISHLSFLLNLSSTRALSNKWSDFCLYRFGGLWYDTQCVLIFHLAYVIFSLFNCAEACWIMSTTLFHTLYLSITSEWILGLFAGFLFVWWFCLLCILLWWGFGYGSFVAVNFHFSRIYV